MAMISSKLASHFQWVLGVAWVEGNWILTTFRHLADHNSPSLAWMEMRTTLAKLHFLFDLAAVKPDLDWHKESRMQILWLKPALPVRVELAQAVVSESVG